MLEAQHRFGFAIAFLLFAKSAQGEAAIMPDDRGRAKRDDVACLLQAPAEIDVVAGLAIFGIEPADAFKGPAIKGHVTTGNVLGHRVGEQNVARSAGRRRDAGLDPVLRRRRNIRPADSGESRR